MANGEHIEVAKAYVTIVPSMEGSQATITKELTGVTSEASEKAGEEGGSKFGEKFAGALKTTAGVIAGAMAAATGAAVATGKAFIDAANDVSAMGDTIGDTAAKMGISTQAYQEWDFVLQRAGTSIDSMKTAMKTLANAAVEGNDAFTALGISQEQLASMSQEEIFSATITALQNVEDSTTRTALASKLLGKGAIELGGVFEMTAEETEAAKQKMYELGAYMDEDAIAASDNYQDTLLDLQDSFKGLKVGLMKNFLPGITSVMDGLAKVFSGDSEGIGAIKDGLADVIDNITAAAPQFFSLAQEIFMSLISGFAPMLPQLVSTIFTVLVQAITTLTSMIPQLMPSIISGIQGIVTALFEALPIIVQGIGDLITSLILWLSEGDNVTKFVNGIIALTAQIAGQLSELLPVLLPAVVKIISDIALCLSDPENITLIVSAVIQILVAVFEALVNCVPVLIDFVIGLFDQLTDLFASFLEIIVPIFTQWAVNGYNKVKEFGNNIKNFFSNVWANIKNGVSNFFTAVGNFFTNGFNNIKTKVTNALEGIKNKFTSIFEGLKTLVKNAIDKIRDFFDFSWELPHLDMPHFSISGSFSLDPPSVPRLSVDWYAKAMHEPYIMDNATIFGAASGRLLGGGEAGSEVIVGTQKLMDMMRQAVGGGQPITINVYGAEGQSAEALADAVAYKLEEMTKRKGQVYA